MNERILSFQANFGEIRNLIFCTTMIEQIFGKFLTMSQHGNHGLKNRFVVVLLFLSFRFSICLHLPRIILIKIKCCNLIIVYRKTVVLVYYQPNLILKGFFSDKDTDN